MKHRITLIATLICYITVGCNQAAKKEIHSNRYKARVFQTELNQFGYDLYKDSAIVIHQPIIPGLPGNKGFSSKDDAQKVADLIIYKLAAGIMPPSVTVKELDSLNVKH